LFGETDRAVQVFPKLPAKNGTTVLVRHDRS